MPSYHQGKTVIIPRGSDKAITSILDIDFKNGLWLYVFPGRLSQNDLWVKFRNENIPRSTIRTPKHIHWAVDILIKKFGKQNLTDAFLNDMLTRWGQITPLPDRKMQTVMNNLTCSRNNQFLIQYQQLNHYGFFDIEFLTHLMELLMLQEKTNNPQAYMFKNVVGDLLSSNDLYKILSTAGYRGGK
jgi:hypothetical protein